MQHKGRVLVIAGSDSGGGAGIQADIKAVTALAGFAMTAITALTAQNTLGVHGVHPVPADFLRLQISCVLSDLGADAIKTGMLGDAATVELVAAGDFGKMVAFTDSKIGAVSIAEAVGNLKTVPLDGGMARTARALGICLGD